LSYESLKSRKRRIFLLASYIQGQVRENQGAVKSTKAGLSPQKGDVRKKRKEKKKTKEGGLSPQEGDVRKTRKEKKRKRPRKVRRWLQQRQGSMCPGPRIPFFGSGVFGFRSGPS
jgi:hypothetical protein